MFLPLILLSLLFFMTIFFGGAHVWAQSIFILVVFLFTLIGLGKGLWGRGQGGPGTIPVLKDPLSLIGILFLGWAACALIPLPADIVKALSPKTFEFWEAVKLVGGRFPHPLSLYPFITANSWIFAFGLLLFYGLALYGIGSHRQIDRLVMGILALGVMESLYALIQLATAQPYILWWKKTVSENVSTGTFIDRNHLAGFLSMIICLGVGYLWALGKGQEKRHLAGKPSWVQSLGVSMGALGTRGFILLSALGLMMAALLTTASRGGTLTLLAGLIFMTGLVAARFFKTRKAFILLLALFLVFLYVGYLALDRVMERFHTIDLSFDDRLDLAEAAYQMAKDFSWTGVGFGVFEFVYPAYQFLTPEVLFEYAHNDWVQLFAETGIVGLALVGIGFFWFMGRSLILWRKRHDPFSVGLGMGGLGALVTIACHSLSEFNLHMPANALLLALIMAITTRALQIRGPQSQKTAAQLWSVWKLPRWTAWPLLVFLLVLVGLSGVQTLRVWQAESLARTFWNSTLPFKEPSPGELKKAWNRAPDNAAFWGWMAAKATKGQNLSLEMAKALNQGPKDLDLFLLGEGLKRNPTAWGLWREISWAAFLKDPAQPDYYLSLAVKAISQSSRLHPFSAQGHFESGLIGLAAYARLGQKGVKRTWQEAFNRAVSMNPALSLPMTDQLLLYLGPSGAKEVKAILLPAETQPYLLTAVYLCKQKIYPEGLELLSEGERLKEREIERFWEEVSTQRERSQEERTKLIDRILALDPFHPGALLRQGRVLEALRSQERRTGGLRDLADPKALSWNLKLIEDKKPEESAETAFFLGRLAEETGDLRLARFQFQRSLQINPQSFPDWIHLKKVLTQLKSSAGDDIELETIQKKIRFFEMEEVVGDAWIGVGFRPGEGQWKVPYRNSHKQEKMEVLFSGEIDGVWELMLDGRFVTAWAGNNYTGEKKMMIPPGEHEFRLVAYNEGIKKNPEKLPFKLTIRFN